MHRLSPLWGVIRPFYDAYLRFSANDGWAIASHVALTILTSMFPFLIFITALAGFFGTQELADQATGTLLQTWPPQVAQPLADQINNVLTHSHSGLVTLGGALSIYFSSSGIEALRVGLDRAYEAKDKRAWWLSRLISIGFVFIGAMAFFALGFLIVLAPLLWSKFIHFFPAARGLENEVTYARLAIAAALLFVALIVIHRYLPAGRRSMADIAPGIALTLLLWIEGGYFFGVYIAEAARNYVNVYAGLASVMILLVFLYMLAAIFIYGAELNASIMFARQRRFAEAEAQRLSAPLRRLAGPSDGKTMKENDPFSLQRFVEAQEGVYPRAVAELRAGCKDSHWMWFIFPQIEGLAQSETAKKYAISSRAEAAAYLAHPILGPRLRECTEIVNKLEGRTAQQIFGHPDDLKFRSSMTLFAAVADDPRIYADALHKYFGGAADMQTLERI
ncbi:MAG TPA: YhjD/YihY/BrkB family envelope integrity protein [Methylovirgula sp.]